jgi:hypothetical protein
MHTIDRSTLRAGAALFLLAAGSFARAATPAIVPVGNPGNSADATGYGAVAYTYQIGKYEVTNAEYCEFLNGAAKTDTCQLIKNGEIKAPDHAALAAGKETKWVLPSENEWYKAAYYDPTKPGGAGYWPYAGKGGGAPECNLNTNKPTEVGHFDKAASAYGTFDQNGNQWEYNETMVGGKVGQRGGSWYLRDRDSYLRSGARYLENSDKWPHIGFRVAALGASTSTANSTTAPTLPAEIVPASPAPSTPKAPARTIYISQSGGDDNATGDTPKTPWKTLAKASLEYQPGYSILLKKGDTWNEELAPKGSGTPESPILISSYGEGNRPIIDRQDFKQDRIGIHLENQDGFKIVGIEFARCMTGIYAEYAKGSPTRKFLWIEDCYFHDSLLYQHYEDYPKRKIGLGVCLFSHELANKVVLQDIMVKNCVFRRLASGVWTNSPDNFNMKASFIYNFANMRFDGCLFEEGYQWQLGIRGVAGGSVRNCVTHDIGRGYRAFNGVAGAMFQRCKDWVFEDSEWGFVDVGQGSGDGEAFDFEGNCDNMIMRNCLFHDTDGPCFLLCCYASDPNPNKGIVMENCVLNGKARRPPRGTGKVAILNTTDFNEATWKNCRFYLSPGESLMRVVDPEKDKNSSFLRCFLKDLSSACKSPKLPATQTASPTGATDGQWIQLDFGRPVTLNEIKLKEDPASSISRYAIDYWDANTARWLGCFNGSGIGAEFVAPIVTRTTTKLRLRVIATTKDKAALTAFEAYNDIPGDALDVAKGSDAPKRVGK